MTKWLNVNVRWKNATHFQPLHLIPSAPARCGGADSSRGPGGDSVPGPSCLPGAVVHGGDGGRGFGAVGHRPRAASAPDAEPSAAPHHQRAPPAGSCTTGEEGAHGRLHPQQLIPGEGGLLCDF